MGANTFARCPVAGSLTSSICPRPSCSVGSHSASWHWCMKGAINALLYYCFFVPKCLEVFFKPFHLWSVFLCFPFLLCLFPTRRIFVQPWISEAVSDPKSSHILNPPWPDTTLLLGIGATPARHTSKTLCTEPIGADILHGDKSEYFLSCRSNIKCHSSFVTMWNASL